MLVKFKDVYNTLKKEDNEFVKFTIIEDPVTMKIIEGEIALLNNIKITKDNNGEIILLTRSYICNIQKYDDYVIITNRNSEHYIFTNLKTI